MISRPASHDQNIAQSVVGSGSEPKRGPATSKAHRMGSVIRPAGLDPTDRDAALHAWIIGEGHFCQRNYCGSLLLAKWV